MSEDLNLDQLLEPTPESRGEFDAAVARLVEMGEEHNQVSTSNSRGAEAILGDPKSKTLVDVGCGVYDSRQPGKEDVARSGLRVSVLYWASKEPDEVVHMVEPERWIIRRGVVEEAMEGPTYAFAMQDLETDLPPKSMEWVRKAIAQAGKSADQAFEPFEVNDLLDQAPSAEDLMADDPRITIENVNSYAVHVLESRTKGVQLICGNGAQVSMYAVDANDAYWRRDTQASALNVQVETADRVRYMYLKFSDGSERLTVAVSDFTDKAVVDELRQSGVTLVERVEDFAYGDDVRRGVQAPNDITMKRMTEEMASAMTSGVDGRYLR